MATIYNFDEELTAATDFDSDDDVLLMIDASAKRAKKVSLDILREEMGAIVSTTATTLTVSAASHAGKTIKVASAAPIAITLPAATGTGNKYKFVVTVAATATGHTIKCVGTDDMEAGMAIFDTSATDITAIAFAATATDDTITLDGTTKSGVRGTVIEVEDIETGLWSVLVRGPATGSYATPFSATV